MNMKKLLRNRVFAPLFAIAMSISVLPYASAQSSSSAVGAAGTQMASGADTAPTKAQRKAARKQARAKKNAELKKLEDAGYQPKATESNYPQDIQNAEKKAAAPQGASK